MIELGGYQTRAEIPNPVRVILPTSAEAAQPPNCSRRLRRWHNRKPLSKYGQSPKSQTAGSPKLKSATGSTATRSEKQSAKPKLALGSNGTTAPPRARGRPYHGVRPGYHGTRWQRLLRSLRSREQVANGGVKIIQRKTTGGIPNEEAFAFRRCRRVYGYVGLCADSDRVLCGEGCEHQEVHHCRQEAHDHHNDCR